MAGNFENLPIKKWDKVMLDDMYKTVTRLELWDWLKRRDIPGDGGFMFSSHPEVKRISDATEYDGHSGSSFAWTLRVIESIAKHGWDSYVSKLLSTPTCECYKAQGLVGWCGVAGGGVPACVH